LAATSDVHSTSEDPPVWLIGSVSEDYLWRTLQIRSSSSSSSSEEDTACLQKGDSQATAILSNPQNHVRTAGTQQGWVSASKNLFLTDMNFKSVTTDW